MNKSNISSLPTDQEQKAFEFAFENGFTASASEGKLPLKHPPFLRDWFIGHIG